MSLPLVVRDTDRRTAVLTGLFTASVCFVVHWVGGGKLLSGWPDTRYVANQQLLLFRSQKWMSLDIVMDYGQGLGVWTAPSWLPADLPHFAAFLVTGEFNEAVFAMVLGALLYASTFCLARSFSLNYSASILAGIFSVIFILLQTPFRWVRFTTEGLFPVAICGFIFFLCVFIRMVSADGNFWKLRFSLLVPSFILCLTIAYSGYTSLITVPLVVVGGLFLLFLFRARVDRRAVLALTFAVIVGVVPVLSILRIVMSNATVVAPNSMAGVLRESQIWFYDELSYSRLSGIPYYREVCLVAVAVASFLLLKSGRYLFRALGQLSIAVGTFLSMLSLSHYFLGNAGFEISPRPTYFAQFLYPVYFCTLGYLVSEVARKSIGKFCADRKSECRSFGASGIGFAIRNLGFVLLLVWSIVWVVDNRGLRDGNSKFPSEPGRIIKTLESKFPTRAEEEFRGRVFLLQEPLERDGNGRIFYTESAFKLHEVLTQRGIPVLSIKAHLISPRSAIAFRNWFTNGDVFARNLIFTEKLDISMARLLGVGFVIAQQPIEETLGVQLIQQVGSDYMYELLDPNLGDFSPTNVIVESEVADPVRAIASQRFDVRRDVITDSEVGDLVTATSASFSVVRGEVVVDVVTTGRSLLVIPIEYSSCMKFKFYAGPAEVMRVNYLLTGVLVSKSGRYTLEVKKNPYTFRTCS